MDINNPNFSMKVEITIDDYMLVEAMDMYV